MPDAINVHDLGALEKDVNETSSRIHNYFSAFVLAGAAILVATIGISDVDILLNSGMKLPILNVDVPLLGYALVTPILYLGFHCYLLFEILLLNRKISAHEDCLRREVHVDADRRRLRERLHTFVFVRMVVSQPKSVIEAVSLGIVALSLIFLPLVVFLVIHLRFIAYQSEVITWVNRIVIMADIATLAVAWAHLANLQPMDGEQVKRWNFFDNPFVLYFLVFGLLPFVFLSTAYQGEFLDGVLASSLRSHFPFRYVLKASPKDHFGLFKMYIAPEADPRISSATYRRALRERNFAGAVFDNLDLSGFDLSGTNLQEASLVRAILVGAELAAADLSGARLDFAQLQDANLTGAKLQGASLIGTQLQGSKLIKARMQGATLIDTQLQAASLELAWLQGAELRRVQLTSAILDGAILSGVRLVDPNFQGASFKDTELQGARIEPNSSDDARGADFSGAHVWRASFKKMRIDPIRLGKVQIPDLAPQPPPLAMAANLDFSPVLPWTVSGQTAPSGSEFERFVSGSISDVTDFDARQRIELHLLALKSSSMTKELSESLAETWHAIQQRNLAVSDLNDLRFDIIRSIACRENRSSKIDLMAADAVRRSMSMPLTELHYDAYFGSPYVANAIVRNKMVDGFGQRAAELAKVLSDPDSCPGAAQLAPDVKLMLSAIKNRR